MPEFTKDAYIDVVGLVILVTVFTPIFRVFFTDWFQSLMASFTFILWILFLITSSNKRRMAVKLDSYLLYSNGNQDQVEGVIVGFEEYFPTGSLLLLLILTSALLLVDAVHIEVSNQAYGLLFDGVGGLVLAIESFVTKQVAGFMVEVTSDAGEASLRLWAAVLLGTGFLLQFLSFLI